MKAYEQTNNNQEDCVDATSKSNAMLHLGHSDQDLQPKYAKPWPEASEVG